MLKKGKVERFNHYLRYSFHNMFKTRLSMMGYKMTLENANAEVMDWLDFYPKGISFLRSRHSKLKNTPNNAMMNLFQQLHLWCLFLNMQITLFMEEVYYGIK